MRELAQDFLDETRALTALVRPLPETAMNLPTAFKDWTINMVLRHLHVWNIAAGMSLKGDGSFEAYHGRLSEHMAQGGRLTGFEALYTAGLSGKELTDALESGAGDLATYFSRTDPAKRVRWAGPDMSARSSLTARLMETWAHAQAVYDLLGVVRVSHDRIRNIVVLGNNTYAWTFRVRNQDAPEPRPHLRLVSPSGAIWTFNEPSEEELIEGHAEEFCQVVTQTRNILDTNLRVKGSNANGWMKNAQCFAGAAQPPPAPGARRRAASAPVF